MAALVDILQASPNLRLEVTAKDLMDFAEEIVKRAKSETDRVHEEYGFYTLSEVMKMYGLKDRSTLYKWEKRGYLPCEKVGSRIRYQKALVHKVLGNPNTLKMR